jgi:hypothetical protein
VFAVANSPPRRVLLATDFSAASRAAFQAARVLCLSFQADLYILNVFEYANANPPESGGMLLEVDSFYHDAEQCLDDLIQEARRSDIKCDGKIGSGISHSSILETFCSSMNLSLHCLHVLPRGVKDNSHKGIVPVIITEALQHLVAMLENKGRSTGMCSHSR